MNTSSSDRPARSDVPPHEIVATRAAPQAVGPYSQAVIADGLLFAAGQLGIDPDSGQMPKSVEEQTRRALNNLSAVLKAAGTSRKFVVKTTVFLKDMDHFATMNRVYSEFFPENPPARSTVEVARLPRDGLVEVEAIALLGRQKEG